MNCRWPARRLVFVVEVIVNVLVEKKVEKSGRGGMELVMVDQGQSCLIEKGMEANSESGSNGSKDGLDVDSNSVSMVEFVMK